MVALKRGQMMKYALQNPDANSTLHIYEQHCNVSKKEESLCHNIMMHVLPFDELMLRNGCLVEQ